eukprot:6072016-Amphidinium_carterae.1
MLTHTCQETLPDRVCKHACRNSVKQQVSSASHKVQAQQPMQGQCEAGNGFSVQPVHSCDDVKRRVASACGDLLATITSWCNLQSFSPPHDYNQIIVITIAIIGMMTSVILTKIH